jgi:hypothetical protein
MKVNELIRELQKLPPEAEVYYVSRPSGYVNSRIESRVSKLVIESPTKIFLGANN